jgi:hypothetical protein
LRDRIKQTQTIDFVAKKLYPEWLRRLQRENVDNSAPAIEVAGLAY